MPVEPYDWQRDLGLDFPDNARDEPTLQEVKDRIYEYEHTSHLVDESTGFRHG